MMNFTPPVVWFAAAVVLCQGSFLTEASAATLVLRNASVVDVEATRVHPRQAVVIDGEGIQWVGPEAAAAVTDGARSIDLAGRFVTPALWDMHIHPDRERHLGLMVANGVLGARIMMGAPEHLAWKARIELGELIGPRLFLAGPIIEGPPPAAFATVIATRDKHIVRSAQEAQSEVKRQHAAGFDYIKVYNNLPLEVYEALTDAARSVRMPVVGHVPFEVGLRRALAAGQLSIEHLRGFEQLLVPPSAPTQPGPDLRSRTLAWEYADSSKMQTVVEMARRSGTWQCPTLTYRLLMAPAPEIERYLSTPEAAYLDASWRSVLRDRSTIVWLSNFSEKDFARAVSGFRKQDELLRALHAAGVPLLAGTDSPPWGFSLHGELERLVGAGLTARDALMAATVGPARFIGLGDVLGRIRTGYVADLVVHDANPLERIENVRRIDAVVVRGRFLERAALDGLLQAAAAD